VVTGEENALSDPPGDIPQIIWVLMRGDSLPMGAPEIYI
jgi:hypothetical protein